MSRTSGRATDMRSPLTLLHATMVTEFQHSVTYMMQPY